MTQPNRLPSDGDSVSPQPAVDVVETAPGAVVCSVETLPDVELTELDDAEGASSTSFLSGAYARGAVTVDDMDEIFTHMQGQLTSFIYRMVASHEEAEDLTQTTMLKAYRKLASGTTIAPGALPSWMFAIASNTATDALRRRRIISWVPLSAFTEDRGIGAGVPSTQGDTTTSQVAEPTASVLSPAWAGRDGGQFERHVADQDELIGVLNQLPPKYRECLLLFEFDGYACSQIADMLHTSVSAVKMRLVRARRLFEAAWARRDEPNDESDDDTTVPDTPETEVSSANIPWHRLGCEPLRDAIGHHACDWLVPPSPAPRRKH